MFTNKTTTHTANTSALYARKWKLEDMLSDMYKLRADNRPIQHKENELDAINEELNKRIRAEYINSCIEEKCKDMKLKEKFEIRNYLDTLTLEDINRLYNIKALEQFELVW